MNAKRIYRLNRDLGLKLRNKVPKRRVKAKLRDDRRPAERANEAWAMDFVHDQLATGRKIPRADDRRHLHALCASDRAAVWLPSV